MHWSYIFLALVHRYHVTAFKQIMSKPGWEFGNPMIYFSLASLFSQGDNAVCDAGGKKWADSVYFFTLRWETGPRY